MNSLKFSIIIPAFNAARFIETGIRAVQDNDYPTTQYEIVIADNGSTDDTVSIARACGAIVLECGRNSGIAAMRNKGAAATTGQVLVFIDADVKIPENFLKSAARYFNDDFRGALGFVDDVPEEAGWVGRTWGGVQGLKRPRVMAVDNLPGRNLLVNRTVFDRINGFDVTLPSSEDKDFCMRVVRAGFKVISIPAPAPLHMGYEPDLRTFIQKEFWRQGSALQVARRHGFSMRSLRNPLLGLWHLGWGGLFIFAPLLSGRQVWMWPPLGLWLLPSLLIALKTVSHQRPVAFLMRYFALTFIRWNVAGTALMYQLLKQGLTFCRSADAAMPR